MTGSQVDLLMDGALFQGNITALQGQEFTARVRSTDGSALLLSVNLQLDQASDTATGSVQAQPAGAE